jgi:serine/threonine protein kinase
MILCSAVDTENKKLLFKELPHKSIEYTEADNAPPPEGNVALSVTDEKTRAVFQVFVQSNALQRLGISFTLWNTLPEKERPLLWPRAAEIGRLVSRAEKRVACLPSAVSRRFFASRAFAVRTIARAIHQQIPHSSHIPHIPGIYFERHEGIAHIFVNLKGLGIGMGGFAKVKPVVWLSAPENAPLIVAKKVSNGRYVNESKDHFVREITTLKQLAGKPGIIPLIAGGFYTDKYALFLPLYEADLLSYLRRRASYSLTPSQKLSAASQWLQGLVQIANIGIHGDLSARNLLFKKSGPEQIEAVIADFGTFRPFGQEEHGLTTITFRSPEDFANNTVSPKQDVWALGLCLLQLFSSRPLACWDHKTSQAMAQWTASLRPHWALTHPTDPDTPPLLIQLIDAMLDPRPDHRPSAKVAFSLFTEHARGGWKAAELSPDAGQRS